MPVRHGRQGFVTGRVRRAAGAGAGEGFKAPVRARRKKPRFPTLRSSALYQGPTLVGPQRIETDLGFSPWGAFFRSFWPGQNLTCTTVPPAFRSHPAQRGLGHGCNRVLLYPSKTDRDGREEPRT